MDIADLIFQEEDRCMKQKPKPKKENIPRKERALLGIVRATSKWPGMRLEIETSAGAVREPHIHLYPANHKSGDTNDLITRIALPEQRPVLPSDVYAIKNSPPVPKDYIQPIIKWAAANNKLCIKNWIAALSIWEAINWDKNP